MKLFNIFQYAFCFQIIIFSTSCGNMISDAETDGSDYSGEVSYVRGLVKSKWEHVPFSVKITAGNFSKTIDSNNNNGFEFDNIPLGNVRVSFSSSSCRIVPQNAEFDLTSAGLTLDSFRLVKDYWNCDYTLEGSAVDCVETDDAYYICGTVKTALRANDIFLTKVYFDGDVIWTKYFGSIYGDESVCLRALGNRLLIASNSVFYDKDFAGSNVRLILTDMNGDLIEEKLWGGAGYETVNDIYVESSSFVMAGTVDGINGFDMVLVRFGYDLTEKKMVNLGGSGDEYGCVLVKAGNSFCYFGKAPDSSDGTVYNPIVRITDEEFNETFAETFASGKTEIIKSAVLAGGVIYFCGSYYDGGISKKGGLIGSYVPGEREINKNYFCSENIESFAGIYPNRTAFAVSVKLRKTNGLRDSDAAMGEFDGVNSFSLKDSFKASNNEEETIFFKGTAAGFLSGGSSYNSTTGKYFIKLLSVNREYHVQ